MTGTTDIAANARTEIGGRSLPAKARWEPEMGANVNRLPRTQPDPPRMSAQVKGSPFDSVRP
jgi:hypothetical protein